MARSFSRPSPENMVENFRAGNLYYHEASDTWYEMTERDGKYFQRRFQKGPFGDERNVDIKSIDYVMGSGNHARTYLHRTPEGTLSELPLSWYAEKGGSLAMSPGYDNPRHPGSRRPIGYDCMFCHNQYPKVTPVEDRFGDPPVFAGELPEGIDCQRCHGPGGEHVASGGAAAKIVNPARLTADRQMEVCLQCHLEPDSFRPTLNFKRYERGSFSYTPGEPLAAFMSLFDTPQPAGGDRFQIAGAAWELRGSACFLKSQGALGCTTCHDPHEERHASESAEMYNDVCQSCHARTNRVAGHPSNAGDCIGCHMQKRRTQDVVHVAMTDHRIRRQPLPGDLLAAFAEIGSLAPPPGAAYPYYPATTGNLEGAVAQVRAGANPGLTVPALEKALAAAPARRPEPWFELAEAERSAKKLTAAAQSYRSALQRDPNYFPALLGLSTLLEDEGRDAESVPYLQRASKAAPADARPWAVLGKAHEALGRKAEAKTDFTKAAQLDPDNPDGQNGLGILLAEEQDIPDAEACFREAVRIQPNHAGSHANLARILAAKQDLPGALTEYSLATHLAPEDAGIRFDYGSLLNAARRFVEATVQLEAAVSANPGHAEAHALLGNLREREGRTEDALAEYRAAVRLRPEALRAQLDLGAVLLKQGDRAGAISHLKLAAADPALRPLALRLLSAAAAAR